MKFERVKEGEVYYDVQRQKMGNTTIKTVRVYPCKVESIDPEGRFVMARWNHNPAQKFYRRAVEKWRVKRPLLVKTPYGAYRLATREEIKAMKETGEEK